eukprot:7341537-Ditylum_brightwellii.AAC.1
MDHPHPPHHPPKWASANRQMIIKKKVINVYDSKIKGKNTTHKQEAVLTSTGAKEDVITSKNNDEEDDDNDDNNDESPKKHKVLQPPTDMRI